MGQVCQLCPSLCPKRKKKEVAYDVHQQTFQMDDNIQQNQNIDNLKSQSDRNNNNILKGLNNDYNNQLGSDIKMFDENQNFTNQSNTQNETLKFNNSNVQAQKKYVEEKINNSHSHSSENSHKVQIMEQENIIQKKLQIKKLQQLKQKQIQQKPRNPNILSSKKPAKKKFNPDDYRFLNQQNAFKVKKVSSIKQQQYNIDKCRNCTYFIFDITANVYIDQTQNCFIFIAPCQSTIFVRNCKNLFIIAATKQFRTYQCHNCQFSLYCKSQPVIESSSGITFSSFQAPIYPQLAKQFSKTKLEVWNNHWSQIHNFTKKQGQKHHFLKRKITQGWYLQNVAKQKQINWKKAFQQAQLQMVEDTVLVPFIQGQYFKTDVNEQKVQFYNKFTQKALIVFNKQTSKDNNEIQKVLNYQKQNQKQFIILKGNHNKLAEMGKDPLVAILIAYKNEQILEPIKQKAQLLINQQEEVNEKMVKYFVNFGDQRQK